jgi:uncharacterized protein YbjQ (UPF0145 family)
MVYAVVSGEQEKAGCGGAGGLPVQKAYEEAGRALYAAAKASKGDGVIHVGFDYRLSARSVGCNNTKPTFEVYGWGTAIKIKNPTNQ